MSQERDSKLTRRSLLGWIGKGCVMSLGAATLASCRDSELNQPGDAQHPQDARVTDLEVSERLDGATSTDAERPGDALTSEAAAADTTTLDAEPPPPLFPFYPGTVTDPSLQDWPELTIDQQDLASILATWRLSVSGLVQAPRTYSFAELLQLGVTNQVVDFHCVKGWSVLDIPWNGVHLSRILHQVLPLRRASHVTFHTVGEVYNESLPLPVALEPRTLLAVGIDGSTLPLKHGFPLRLVVPRLWAYKQAKYVHHIELTDHPVMGYYVKSGSTYDGEVPPELLRPGKY